MPIQLPLALARNTAEATRELLGRLDLGRGAKLRLTGSVRVFFLVPFLCRFDLILMSRSIPSTVFALERETTCRIFDERGRTVTDREGIFSLAYLDSNGLELLSGEIEVTQDGLKQGAVAAQPTIGEQPPIPRTVRAHTVVFGFGLHGPEQERESGFHGHKQETESWHASGGRDLCPDEEAFVDDLVTVA